MGPYREKITNEEEEDDFPTAPLTGEIKPYENIENIICPKCQHDDIKVEYCGGWLPPNSKEFWREFKFAESKRLRIYNITQKHWNAHFKCLYSEEHLHLKCYRCDFKLNHMKCCSKRSF